MAEVTFKLDNGTAHTLQESDLALKAVRASFNPSGLEIVLLLKTCAAAFLTLLDRVEDADPCAGFDVNEARTLARSACMWAVLAATRGK
jgi:hypothetical protein